MGEVEEQMGFLARKKRRKEEEEGKKKLSVPRKYRKVGPESIGVAPPRFPPFDRDLLRKGKSSLIAGAYGFMQSSAIPTGVE